MSDERKEIERLREENARLRAALERMRGLIHDPQLRLIVDRALEGKG